MVDDFTEEIDNEENIQQSLTLNEVFMKKSKIIVHGNSYCDGIIILFQMDGEKYYYEPIPSYYAKTLFTKSHAQILKMSINRTWIN